MTVDDNVSVVNMTCVLLNRIDPAGDHRGFYDPGKAIAAAGKEVFDVAFLDVEMPDMNGIELAKKLQRLNPLINIVFITGHPDYMPNAFELFASGYILKPVTEKSLKDALYHLRYRGAGPSDKPIQVRCFGLFEVFIGGSPVRFSRAKSKELFAYLIDRRGAVCTLDMIIGILWPDEPVDESRKSNARNSTSDLTGTFKAFGIDNVILRTGPGISVNMGIVDCDYFRWLEGDPYAIHQYTGEYMSQYEFAEETRYNLQKITGR